MSFSTDILNALAGISHMLTQCCGGNFFYGLPEGALVNALLWTPAGEKRIRRTVQDAKGKTVSWPS